MDSIRKFMSKEWWNADNCRDLVQETLTARGWLNIFVRQCYGSNDKEIIPKSIGTCFISSSLCRDTLTESKKLAPENLFAYISHKGVILAFVRILMTE